MHEFTPWAKTARLFRDVVVTEKLDGTNSAIHLTPIADWEAELLQSGPEAVPIHVVDVDGVKWAVSAQSWKRIITPGKTTDNFGFAGWVYDNAEVLVRLLGEGLHFGEWWGKGIQRNYGVPGRQFTLFNTERYEGVHEAVGDFEGIPVLVSPVPVLYQGVFSEDRIIGELEVLRKYGSVAAPGFMNPEGICIYHTQTRGVFKVTLDNQDAGKWEAAA
ncbi:RNA ligase family protein [Streptomyces althioticus]|uniref:RNA ligase family protein n=1 Tax=Streptomyces althioticus TaxID=83380 RepID=A0ABZ1YB91_9ACTN